MAYIEYLTQNQVSVNMMSNNLSAMRASFIMYALPHQVLDHPCIVYFVKSFIFEHFEPGSQIYSQF